VNDDVDHHIPIGRTAASLCRGVGYSLPSEHVLREESGADVYPAALSTYNDSRAGVVEAVGRAS